MASELNFFDELPQPGCLITCASLCNLFCERKNGIPLVLLTRLLKLCELSLAFFFCVLI